MESKHLDDFIKKALENFEALDQDNSWAQMEQLLNDPANSDLAERGEDHIYRSKLEELQPEMPAGHWELMAASLNALEAESIFDEVDGKAYEHLNNLEVPYNEEHWPLMEEKIAAEMGWRNAVMRYKIMEMMLVFLFAFTFMQFWPEAKTLLPKIKEEVKQVLQHDAIPFAAIKDIDLNTADASSQNNPTANSNIETAIVETSASQINNNLDQTTFSTASTTVLSSREASSEVPTVNSSILNIEKTVANNSVAGNSNIDTRIVIPTIDELNSKEVNPNVPKLGGALAINTPALSERARLDLMKKLSSLPLTFLPSPLQSLPDCKTCKERKDGFLRIGMHGITSFDLVRAGSFSVNEDRELDLVEDQSDNSITHLASALRGGSSLQNEGKQLKSIENVESFGYGWGFSLGLKKDRFEIVTGLNYLIKTHTPDKVFLDVKGGDLRLGFAGYGWAGSQFNFFNIPLGLRFDFVDNVKWKVYGQAGLSFSMALEVNDKYQEVIINRYGNFNSNSAELEDIIENTTLFENEGAKSGDEILANTFQDPQYTNEKSGILHGGDFSRFSFFNIDPSFGVERRFTSRYSGFFNAGYTHQINGQSIGSTGVKINSFHAQIGLKVSLKKLNK